MAKYLPPDASGKGFDAGGTPAQGVRTSTAGFIGAAEKGPTSGAPVLVTNFSSFQEKFGSYLPKSKFGNGPFLAYAVEHFFINGGTRAYIARVALTDAQAASIGKGGTDSENAFPASAYIGTDGGPGKRSGIQAFLDNSEVSLMAVPGITDLSVLSALVTHCEKTASRFAVMDMPEDWSDISKLKAFRNRFDTQYAALYHPWLTVYDPAENRSISLPPSGSVLGIFARSDVHQGVHKAPTDEAVKNCTGLSLSFGKSEKDALDPAGINLIGSFPGRGILLWGARTTSSSNSWKYVNVRRLFIFVEESIRANTNWVVFEPNDAVLWDRVKRTVEIFLNSAWRTGALAGTSASEAFFVKIGPETMTQDDIANGRLIFNIGVAPAKPGEFVEFKITQKTATE